MSTNALALTAGKSIGIHLVPAATLMIGGFLGWKLWQQQQKIKRSEQTQAHFATQLDQLQTEFTKQQSEQIKQNEQKAKEEQKTFSTLFKRTSSSDKNTKKGGLFKQLLNDNIILRKTR